MTSSSTDSNIPITDLLSCRLVYSKFLLGSFLRYRKTFKNYNQVIKAHRKNAFPIEGVLRNGKKIVLVNKIHTTMISFGFEDRCEIKNDLLVIKIRDSKEVKFLDWQENGDIPAVFGNDDYRLLPVENRDVLDIGANIGDTCIYFASKGARKTIGIEPSPKSFESAIKNIKLNELTDKIHVVQGGVGANSGHMYINSEKSGITYFLEQDEEKGIKVPIFILDEIIEKYNLERPILKIDCEGCEYDIIMSSSRETLQKFSHIFIEYHYGYNNIKEKLERCGFKVSIVSPTCTFRSMDSKHKRVYLGHLLAQNHNI